METMNYSLNGEGRAYVNYSLRSLNLPPQSGNDSYVERVLDRRIDGEDYVRLHNAARAIDVSDRFRDVIDTFHTPAGETPAGFRIETTLEEDGLLMVDLVRDISYDKNGMKRPTGTIFSADSANPYEVRPIAPLLGNLTCNPGIVYDLFINNPAANVGGLFKTREEVMKEIGNILGPGCDISVELNNPFEQDFNKILDECKAFEELLTPYRLVVKVPHTGPVNGQNVNELLTGDKKFSLRYNEPSTADAFAGHELALKLREHGYRINFTLMFDPYQTAMAMQAKPAFINSFVRHRLKQTEGVKRCIDLYECSGDVKFLQELRNVLYAGDYLRRDESELDLLKAYKLGKDLLAYRKYDTPEGHDGLDGVRHNLRLLRNNNLRDTRLIICSMEGDYNYPDIDKLLAEPEFADVADRVVITAEPSYLARFSSSNQVVSYQRRFMNAVNNAAK